MPSQNASSLPRKIAQAYFTGVVGGFLHKALA